MHYSVVFCGLLAACSSTANPPHQPVAARAPITAEQLEALSREATAAYEANQFPRCAELYERLAVDGQSQRREIAQNADYNAACCHARAGRFAPAFAALDRAVALGFHDRNGLVSDNDLSPLHGDSRWQLVVDRVAKAEAALDASYRLPALRKELLALVAEDQAARFAMIGGDNTLVAKVEAIDRRTTARMKEVVEQHGWPSKALVGEDGAHAAWLLVQHADADPAFQKRCLALIEPMVATGEVSAQDHAYLWDRVAVADHRPQRWGTQFGPDRQPRPIEDPTNVDRRRAAIGLPTMETYKRDMIKLYGPPERSAQ